MTITAPSILEAENARLRAALKQMLDLAEWQHQMMTDEMLALTPGQEWIAWALTPGQEWVACVAAAPVAIANARRTLEGL